MAAFSVSIPPSIQEDGYICIIAFYKSMVMGYVIITLMFFSDYGNGVYLNKIRMLFF